MKVILVDNFPVVRKGIVAILSSIPGTKVIAEASNVNQAIDVINKGEPDLILIELKLGRESGLNALEKIKKRKSDIILLFRNINKDDFVKAERIGVNGYVSKLALEEEILYAVNIVNKGRKYYDPQVYDIVSKPKDNIDVLTPREIQVLCALGMGLSNKKIALKFFITEYTVKKHVSQILSKLNFKHRTEAALYANAKEIVKYNKKDDYLAV